MNVEVCREPYFHLVINNFFPTQINKRILKEAISLEGKFTQATTGNSNIKPDYRSNKVCYYDEMYSTDRSKSMLLTQLESKFVQDGQFRGLLSTSPPPIGDFLMTNKHETQVSRYGEKEYYEWHVDRFANMDRHLTLIYYFFEEPQKFTGGELEITDSPAHDEILFEKSPNIKTIIPKNNMAIIIGADKLHRVLPVKSPKEFGLGRFSVNCWIGFSK
jgi:SM-20-related protein